MHAAAHIHIHTFIHAALLLLLCYCCGTSTSTTATSATTTATTTAACSSSFPPLLSPSSLLSLSSSSLLSSSLRSSSLLSSSLLLWTWVFCCYFVLHAACIIYVHGELLNIEHMEVQDCFQTVERPYISTRMEDKNTCMEVQTASVGVLMRSKQLAHGRSTQLAGR